MIRHVRPKFSCRVCETITQAQTPELPIRRGRATAGLLAHVLVAKFADHLPFYRQSEIGRDHQHTTFQSKSGRTPCRVSLRSDYTLPFATRDTTVLTLNAACSQPGRRSTARHRSGIGKPSALGCKGCSHRT